MRKMARRVALVLSVLGTSVAFTAGMAGTANAIGYDPSCDAKQVGGDVCYER